MSLILGFSLPLPQHPKLLSLFLGLDPALRLIQKELASIAKSA